MMLCTALDAEVLPRTRAEAMAMGAKRYFAGEPCKRGHLAYRIVSGSCSACAKLKRDEWRFANADRDRANCRAFTARKRAADPRGVWLKMALHHASWRARRAGVPFSLDAADVIPLMSPLCPVLHVPLSYGEPGKGKPYSATIDRIIPSHGYAPGNVAVISRRANTIKNDATPDELLAVAAWAERARGAANIGGPAPCP